ncbi:MAG: flagellin [Lachnospiraceae bacterium]|nr:flagellin [Lachnospiraceae bacterium]
MKINNNISAVITNKQLLRTENTLAMSMERLSSGLRINHAKDNPSGIAISGKMQAQIDALGQSSDNSNDGISVLETADGALGEVTSIIQRMRELSVQAANDINSQSEKDAIQTEIASLKEEIDRISSTTEFNTKSLLNGSLDAHVYANDVTRIQVNSNVPAGVYELSVDSVAQKAQIAMSTSGLTYPITEAQAGTITINGSPAAITAGMTQEQVLETIRTAAEHGDAEIELDTSDNIVGVNSKRYGNSAGLLISASTDELANALGISTDGSSAVGVDANVTLDKASAFGSQATVAVDGNKATITDVNGFNMSMLIDEGYTGNVSLEVTDVGPMDLQIGANEGQQMSVRIPATDTKSLYIDDLDVSTVSGAARGIGLLDAALTKVNEIRANLGAYENRLEHTVSSLDQTEENMTSAISRIQDVDMAEEMVEYTKQNVLAQAGTSALSQANEMPQMALQLLQ